ncbi:MAG: FGGY-family carbohydrate kinase [bacterium]
MKRCFYRPEHDHKKASLFRSIMELVIFSFRDVEEIFTQLGMDFNYIATSGRGAQSNLWGQIHPGIFKKKMVPVSGSRVGAAYRAAIVAGVGSGIWADFEEAASLLKVETVNHPEQKSFNIYDHYYSVYKSFYPLLKENFKAFNI